MTYNISELAKLTSASRATVTRYVTKDKTIFKKTTTGNKVVYETSLSIDQILELFKQKKIQNNSKNIIKYNKLRSLNKL